MPQKQNDWGKQRPYRSMSALSRSRRASGWAQSSLDIHLESVLHFQVNFTCTLWPSVSSERGFIWIKSSLGKKFEEPAKVFWISSAVSSSTHRMGKGFTQLKTKQCYSFKYCIIVFKLTVIHYRDVPLGAEHTGPDPVEGFLPSLEPRVLLTVFSWSIAWNEAHPWYFCLMGITVHSTLWDRVWCSSSVTALYRTARSFFRS